MKFTVIVPLYNKAPYIERTLNSIVNQTFHDFELIVIDDGSSDGSEQIAAQFLYPYASYSKVIHQTNSGVAAARNKGVSIANGQYLAFLDADDWWESDFLENLAQLIERYPKAAMLGTGFYIIKNGKKKVAPIGVPKEFESGYINYCQTYAKTLCMPISSSSVAVRKDAFIAVGQFRMGITLGEDFDLWIRLALKYPVALINKPLANYNQDIPKKLRATRRLHNPSHHMLWNLDYLSELEKTNKDYKVLIDRLRSSGLLRYYLSRKYHNEAMVQLEKIDWSNIGSKTYKLYHSSLAYQRIKFKSLEIASTIKQFLIQTTSNSTSKNNTINLK